MISELCIKNLGEDVFSKHFSEIYDDAVREYERCGVFFLRAEYIEEIGRETGAYPRILPLLLSEAERIRENKSLSQYALFLYRAMCKRREFLENIKSFLLPEGVELFGFLCLIPMIKNTYDTLVKMGIDKDITDATLKQFEECVFIYERRFDRLGMNKRYFDWLQHYVDCEILNINRLRFEIHTFSEPVAVFRRLSDGEDFPVMTDGDFNEDGFYADTPPKKTAAFTASLAERADAYIAYPVTAGGRAESEAKVYLKSEYRKIIEKGDTLLSVHIPVEGEFTRETCAESYRRAKEVFKRFFPSLDVKGFVCYSWMMSPELSLYMKPTSRVLGFASQYLRFPIHTEGEDVLNFVFYLKFKTYEDLLEETSLQRGLKKLYLGGGYLYEYGGIFAADKV